MNSKWFLSLATSDYGGGSDDGTVYDTFNDVVRNGLSYLKEQIREWRDNEQECSPDDFDEDGFNSLESNVEQAFKSLLASTKLSPTEEHIHSFGSVACADNVYVILRPATKADVRTYGNDDDDI